LIISNYTGGMKEGILFIHIYHRKKIVNSLLTWFKAKQFDYQIQLFFLEQLINF
jgi:hypothetical protein